MWLFRRLECFVELQAQNVYVRKYVLGEKRPPLGAWCSGITSASHAEGPGFNPQCVHFSNIKAEGDAPFPGLSVARR